MGSLPQNGRTASSKVIIILQVLIKQLKVANQIYHQGLKTTQKQSYATYPEIENPSSGLWRWTCSLDTNGTDMVVVPLRVPQSDSTSKGLSYEKNIHRVLATLVTRMD